MIEYKGYIGKVTFDENAGIIHGEVINTRDVITFQGDSVAEVINAFHESIDDYIDFCKSRGENPDKPFSGQFVTRIPPDLHRQLTVAAVLSGKSLNAWVAEQLQEAVLRTGAMKAADTQKLSPKTPQQKPEVLISKPARRKKKESEHRQ
ncbi:MAG: type II toxin-antitoxin system HicB family antitoxin [Isosphaeraceae bacterium]